MSETATEFSGERITAQVAELLEEDPAEISADDNLVDFGLDSIRIMTLVERFRRAGATVGFVELAERPTVQAWQALLSASTHAAEQPDDA